MAGYRLYYLDQPTPAEADSHYPNYEPRLYARVIRKLATPGWTFRFTAADDRGAMEMLTNLNFGKVAA